MSSSARPEHPFVANARLTHRAAMTCDIFCTVIDNFGDIGICWRLARQLTNEYGWQVRLIVDDLSTFHRLCKTVDAGLARQCIDSIVIERWQPHTDDAGDTDKTRDVPDIVIEAFGCALPPDYIAAMARRPPVWINLEYLSAEDWVADFHLNPSPHPRHALTKTFFFPGFGVGTGGVLKEPGLEAARLAFEASPEARIAWWRQATGALPPQASATVISLFAYENPAIDALLEQWRDQTQAVVLLVPEGRISPAIGRFFGLTSFEAGTCAARGNLRAYALEFVEQTAYDALLWVSDVNFARGEDSFVRAQWARRPSIWHIYPQADDAHLRKLDAALAHYTATLPRHTADSVQRFWHAWNGHGTPDWSDYWQHRAALMARATSWAQELASIGDLAKNLVNFVKSQLK